ncbi:MAG: YdcH family protein [Ignavibacteriales bacterium]
MNDDESIDDPEAILRAELAELRQEHQDLDDAIEALAARTVVDQLQIARLKRKKLALRDAIQKIEDQLTPDIIA